MRRVQVPNGELTAKQLRFLAGCIEPYAEKGCADITTRANLQLRGLTLGEADQIMEVRRLCGRMHMRDARSIGKSRQIATVTMQCHAGPVEQTCVCGRVG